MGRLVESAGETTCSSCGIVVAREAVSQPSAANHRGDPGNHLGSFMGTKDDEHSASAFNENSTVRRAKLLSDYLGETPSGFTCLKLVERVADRLSLPGFVRDNAILLSRKLLAERQNHGATIPAISTYALISACRSAGIHHVDTRKVMQVHSDLGHRVTKSKLLRLGIDSSVRLPPNDPEGLAVTVVKGLQSSRSVMVRLGEKGIEATAYFSRLLQASKAVIGEARGKRGISPRTLAAGSVYVAALRMPPKAFTQREVSETVGIAEYTVREFCGWAHREGVE